MSERARSRDEPAGAASGRIRVLRVIARLNIGGPAIQAISLTSELERRGYETTLVRGREARDEGSMDDLAERLKVTPLYVPSLRRNPGAHDLRALLALVTIIARGRPQIVHTHAAKAGTLGRLAAMLAPGRSERVLVHTFHGHSLSGYFSSRTARLYCAIERLLAKHTDRLIAVSPEVRDELVAMGVAPPERFEVIRLGFDLSNFALQGPAREHAGRLVRERYGIPPDALLVTLIARVVEIKRVDRFIDMASRLAEERPDVWFLIVGDGDRRSEYEVSPPASAIGERLIWTGFQRDIPSMCFASDVVVLTSDNEGTPVSLIEAQAAGVPVVTTRVGGVQTVVIDGRTGTVVGKDATELANAVGKLLDEPESRARMGAIGRQHSADTFSIERLVADIHDLYGRLLGESPGRG